MWLKSTRGDIVEELDVSRFWESWGMLNKTR